MYIPEAFEVTSPAEKIAFIEENNFGQLISLVEGRLYASHLPFVLNEDKTRLLCHIARENPQWENIEQQEVMVTLEGPHAYVSPSWYASSGVPTWNYQTAHIYGSCRVVCDTEGVKQIVDLLTARFESRERQPWIPEYKEQMLQAIIGMEINITDIRCKFKLSQNRSDIDRANVAEQLRSRGSIKLAAAIG